MAPSGLTLWYRGSTEFNPLTWSAEWLRHGALHSTLKQPQIFLGLFFISYNGCTHSLSAACMQKHVGKKTRFAAKDHILTLGTIGAGRFCGLSLCEASQVICPHAHLACVRAIKRISVQRAICAHRHDALSPRRAALVMPSGRRDAVG